MNAPRSLRVVAILLAAASPAPLSTGAHAATADIPPAHHHHKKDGGAQGHQTGKVSGHAETHKTPAAKHHKSAHAAESTKTTSHEKRRHKEKPRQEKPHRKGHPAHPAAKGTAPANETTPRPAVAPLPGTDTTGPVPPDQAAPADNANGQDPTKGSNTGLPLPRFAALRADEVNLRAGPGQRYPIQWVYRRRGLPVQIDREFDIWRLIEDQDGVKGWVHQATLVGSRDFVVPSPAGSAPPPADAAAPPSGQTPENAAKALPQQTDDKQASARHTESRIVGYVTSGSDLTTLPGSIVLRSSADDSASVAAVLTPGTVGTIKTCAAGAAWCKVSVQRYEGWVRRNQIWGISADEVYPPS